MPVSHSQVHRTGCIYTPPYIVHFFFLPSSCCCCCGCCCCCCLSSLLLPVIVIAGHGMEDSVSHPERSSRYITRLFRSDRDWKLPPLPAHPRPQFAPSKNPCAHCPLRNNNNNKQQNHTYYIRVCIYTYIYENTRYTKMHEINME